MTNIFEKIDTISQASYAGPSSELQLETYILRGQDGVMMKDYPTIVVRRAWGFGC